MSEEGRPRGGEGGSRDGSGAATPATLPCHSCKGWTDRCAISFLFPHPVRSLDSLSVAVSPPSCFLAFSPRSGRRAGEAGGGKRWRGCSPHGCFGLGRPFGLTSMRYHFRHSHRRTHAPSHHPSSIVIIIQHNHSHMEGLPLLSSALSRSLPRPVLVKWLKLTHCRSLSPARPCSPLAYSPAPPSSPLAFPNSALHLLTLILSSPLPSVAPQHARRPRSPCSGCSCCSPVPQILCWRSRKRSS